MRDICESRMRMYEVPNKEALEGFRDTGILAKNLNGYGDIFVNL